MSGGFKITQPKTNYVALVSNSSSSGSAGSSLETLDEGVPLSTATASIDFVGAGVTATAVGDAVTVTIPSGTPTFATPAIVLGTAAAAGAASTVIRSDSTIVAFDATVPVTQAFGDTAATGSATVAARRDHKHGMPSSTAVRDAGRWEVVMTVGITDPPEPVWTADGTDYVYAWVTS